MKNGWWAGKVSRKQSCPPSPVASHPTQALNFMLELLPGWEFTWKGKQPLLGPGAKRQNRSLVVYGSKYPRQMQKEKPGKKASGIYQEHSLCSSPSRGESLWTEPCAKYFEEGPPMSLQSEGRHSLRKPLQDGEDIAPGSLPSSQRAPGPIREVKFLPWSPPV